MILNHNRPTAYLIPAATYEAILDQLDDLDLARLVGDRQAEPSTKVRLDDL